MTTTPKTGLTDKFRTPATKVCNTCKGEKPIKEFSRTTKSPDRFNWSCRACKKAYDDNKKEQGKERAKTFFDAKFFTLALLLSTSTAFSQVADSTIALREYNWSTAKPTSEPFFSGVAISENDLNRRKPDTVRAIILATMCRKCAAEPIQGYVVITPGKPVVYLDRCKRALKWPQVGWDWREVKTNLNK